MLTKQTNTDVDTPRWFPMKRFFDTPMMSWPDLFDEGTMRVEEFEDDGNMVVRAEMAGIDPDKDVEITMADHRLRITAERREESKTEDKKGYRSEFRYGSFTRTLPLPAGATEKDVKATYVDGILEIRVPIDTEEAESRRVPVTRG